MVRIPERFRRFSSRRRELAAFLVAAAGATLAAGAALPVVQQQPPPPQTRDTIIITGAAGRWAMPDCVPKRTDEASQAACRTITQVLRADLRFEDLFQLVQD